MTQIHQSNLTHESNSSIQPLLHDEHVTDWMWATSEWVDEQIDEQFAIWAGTSHPFTPQDADLDIPF